MQLEVGAVVEGKITGFTSFGAFVDLGGGKKGMVHISEVSSQYVEKIDDVLTVGQDVKVKILSIGDDGKIGLSIKKAVEPEKPQNKRKFNAPRKSSANVWQGTKNNDPEPDSFETMMAKFKQQSDERMSDLKRDSKHGGGYNRRGTKKL